MNRAGHLAREDQHEVKILLVALDADDHAWRQAGRPQHPGGKRDMRRQGFEVVGRLAFDHRDCSWGRAGPVRDRADEGRKMLIVGHGRRSREKIAGKDNRLDNRTRYHPGQVCRDARAALPIWA